MAPVNGDHSKDAAAPPATMNDATIAQVFQSIETLTSVFNFTPEVAQQAIEAVGIDVTECYNYILDKGLGNDQGGPIVPIDNCPHIQHHVKLSVEHLPSPHARCHQGILASSTGKAKGEVQDDGSCPPGENWGCLECGTIGCSRYVNGHGLLHYEESLKSEETKGEDGAGHCIAVSMADLSVWCHACNAYLKDRRLDFFVKKLQELKFGKDDEDPDDAESEEDDDDGADEDSEDEVDDGSEDEREQPSSPTGEEGDQGKPAALARSARGMPLGRGIYGESDDDEDIEYPFGSCPSSLKDVASFINSDACQSIVVLAGAGLSTNSGIPDFRSVGGLYDTLKPELLTASELERIAIRMDPTIALNQNLFLENPLPCLELNRPFLLGTRDGKWKATLGHRFVELLHTKTGKLTRMYTQNIDGLEVQCKQLPHDKIIAVHGSMSEAECARCGTKSDFNEFCRLLELNIKDIHGEDPDAPKESKGIECAVCGYEALKPSIVLFKSPLPKIFFETVPRDMPHVDLLLVIGTSLAVAPANSIVVKVPKRTMRVVVNREHVGSRLGIDYSDESKRDFFAKGDSDAILLDLMVELGWLDDLSRLIQNDLPEESARVLKARLERERKEKIPTFASA
jgi:NAD+-dependent protein deacetylase sirtuin 2